MAASGGGGGASTDGQRRNLIIAALVKQVKEGTLSKHDLFTELSALQQQKQQQQQQQQSRRHAGSEDPVRDQERRESQYSSDGFHSSASYSSNNDDHRREDRNVHRSDAELQRNRREGILEGPAYDEGLDSRRPTVSEVEYDYESAPPPPASHTPSTSYGQYSNGAPALAGPVSGFSNPDRRAFIQRLLEEKRRCRAEQDGVDTRGYPQAGENHGRPRSAPQGRGSASSMPAYPARGSVEEMQVLRDALRGSYGGSRQQSAKWGDDDEENTYRPKIKELPRHYGHLKEKDVPFQTRVLRWQSSKTEDAKRRREENEEREVEGCTFHPSINNASRRHVESCRLPSDRRTVNERLYAQAGMIKEERERAASEARAREEENVRRSCTFKPNLRASRVFSSRPGSPMHRSVDVSSRYLSSPEHVRSRRQRYTSRPPDAAGLQECSFHPVTNKVGAHMASAKLYLAANVVERLTRHTSASPSRYSYGYSDADCRSTPGTRTPRLDSDMDNEVPRPLDRPVMDMSSFMSSIQRNNNHQHVRPSSAPGRRRSSGGELYSSSEANTSFNMMTKEEREARRQAFHEFLARQRQRELHKKKKIEEIANKCKPRFAPELCKLSMLMVRDQSKGSFLERMERDVLKKEHLSEKLKVIRDATERQCPFRPTITRSSAAREPRSAVDMSRGDMLRRETNQRLLRLRMEKERFSEFTFRPKINNNSPTARQVQSKLRVVSEPETYLERLQREAQRKTDMARRAVQEREMAEVQECTFKPQTYDCPAFIKRIARSLALTRSAKPPAQVETKPEWR